MSSDPTLEEEVRRLERHYSVNPEGLVFARLADAYRRCGRLDRALELLREGLERHPEYATGHLIEGRTLREAGRATEAAEAFRRVLELDAENLVALRSLAELAAERGERAEARDWAERLQRADPFAGSAAGAGAPDRPEGPPEAAADPGGGRPDAGGGDAARRGPAADPSTDSSLPGEEGLADEIAAMADDQWWSSTEDDGEEGDESRVATETMAQLYAQQGLYEQAADVYRRLVARRPEDEALRSRKEEMERRAAEADGADRGADEEERPERDAGRVTAREHFRALLRGRAEPGRDRSAGTGTGEVPSGEPSEARGGVAG